MCESNIVTKKNREVNKMSLDNPNYLDRRDRILYEKLFYHDNNGVPLTEQEEKFCKTMYHMEEYASGLGGDYIDD